MIWGWIVDGIARLLVQLKLAAAGIVGRVLATMGLSVVTFEGILPNLKAFVVSHISGLSGDTMSLLGYLGIGQAMSMILSALTIRLAWKVFIIPKSIADSMGGAS